MKLQRAGFPDGLLISSCDAAESREEIVRNGITMAEPLTRPPATLSPHAERGIEKAFDRITVFGDAIWDLRTARNLELPFIGVGTRSGSECAIADYRDPDAVLALMSEARAPR